MGKRIRLDRVLAVIGLLLLGYVGETLVEGRVREALGERRLEKAWTTVEKSPAAQPVLQRPRPAAGDLLGRLEIPRIGLTALVAEGSDESTLRTAIGHIPQTPLPGEPGNVALAAHRDTIFRALRKIEVGDRLKLHSWEGETEYEVVSTQVVKPTEVSILAQSEEPRLTLITCYPFSYIGPAPKRFVVHARPVDPAKESAPRNAATARARESSA